MLYTPVDIRTEMLSCDASHPHAMQDGQELWIRYISSLVPGTNHIDRFKGMTEGYVSVLSSEFIRDVEIYHKGIPNVVSTTDGSNLIKLKKSRKGIIIPTNRINKIDGTIVCRIKLI